MTLMLMLLMMLLFTMTMTCVCHVHESGGVCQFDVYERRRLSFAEWQAPSQFRETPLPKNAIVTPTCARTLHMCGVPSSCRAQGRLVLSRPRVSANLTGCCMQGRKGEIVGPRAR